MRAPGSSEDGADLERQLHPCPGTFQIHSCLSDLVSFRTMSTCSTTATLLISENSNRSMRVRTRKVSHSISLKKKTPFELSCSHGLVFGNFIPSQLFDHIESFDFNTLCRMAASRGAYKGGFFETKHLNYGHGYISVWRSQRDESGGRFEKVWSRRWIWAVDTDRCNSLLLHRHHYHRYVGTTTNFERCEFQVMVMWPRSLSGAECSLSSMEQ